MKQLILFIHVIVFSFSVNAQPSTLIYDSTLARMLGADEYGMKSYILVILKTGPNKLVPGPKSDSLFKGHLDNIKRLTDLGKLVIAGPLGENEKRYEGIFIFNVRTIGEAKEQR